MATLRGVWAGLCGAAFLGAALATAAWAEEELAFVRERGDLDRLAIRGAETFGEAEIKQALTVDVDVAVAARPDGALEIYRKVLAEKTLAGYRLEGFADATVAAKFDPAADQFVLEIHEGPRYLAGEVVIEGLDASLADRVREALTVEKPPANAVQPASQPGAAKPKKKVVWSVGEPARLDLESQNRVREKVESSLYESGRLFPQFNMELVPDRVQHTVALKLEFTEPGATAQIDELSVIGNKKFSSDEILEFLELRQGAPWTGDLDRRLDERLRQSGRFTKVKVRTKKPSQAGEQLKTSIGVTEYAKAPSLSESLSREEQALVKLSQWLQDFSAGSDEVAITVEIDRYLLEAIVSPKLGALAILRQRPAAGSDAKQPLPFVWAFVTSEERIGFYSVLRGRKLVAIPTPTPIVADVRLSLHDGPPSLSGKSTYWFGLARVPASKRNRRRHCDFHFHDTPVSLLSLAHEYDSTSHWDGDVLTVEFQERRLKFDATTGRLIEYEATEEGSQLRVSVASGQFELKLAEIDEAARDLPNDAPANVERPVSSILEFLADEAVQFDDCEVLKEFRPQIRVLRKLVSLGLLKPLDRLGAASFQYAAESDEYSIPGKPADFYISGTNFTREWFNDPKTQAKLRDLAAAGGLHAARFLLPAEGWPQVVFREAVFAQADKGAPADRAVDLTKLCASPAAGPLCCLTAAAAAQEWPLGAPTQLLANLGKTKLTLAEFQNDYRPLLDSKSLVGEYLLCLADVLRGLEAEEVETLLAMLKTGECFDERSLDALSAVAAVLRQHREGPVDQALAASLDQLWQLGLREQIAKWLDQSADEPKSPSVPAAPAAPRVAEYGVYQAAPYGVSTEPYGAPATADAAKESNSLPLALEGFCPVTLMEKKAWHEGDTRYSAVHQGQRYLFAGEREKQDFLKSPERFSPVMGGHDVVQFVDDQRLTPGKRENGVFYDFRIWLFETEKSRRKFEENPKAYVSALPDDAQTQAASAEKSSDVHYKCPPSAAAPDASAYPVTPAEPAGGVYGAATEAARDFLRDMMTKSPSVALDGYCPVTLVEKRTWRKGGADNDVFHAGQVFFLAGTIERERFLKRSERFAPAVSGMDVVQIAEQQRRTPGKREFGVFYRDQIWLFESEASRRKFKENPATYRGFSKGDCENDDAAPPDHHSETDHGKCEDLPSVTEEESPADDSTAREKKYRYGEVTEGYAGGSPEKAANAQSGASLFAVVIFPEPGPNDAPPPKLAPGQPQPALDGYSPVTLVELQKWRAGDPRYVAAHRGRVYFCASEFERQAFLKDPDRYAIANDGLDLVEQIDHQRDMPGKREFAAYWSRQLFLFASRASRDLFECNWKYHMVRQSALSVENLGRGDRYPNRPGVSEAISTNSAAPTEATVEKKPARLGRRRAFSRRWR